MKKRRQQKTHLISHKTLVERILAKPRQEGIVILDASNFIPNLWLETKNGFKKQPYKHITDRQRAKHYLCLQDIIQQPDYCVTPLVAKEILHTPDFVKKNSSYETLILKQQLDELAQQNIFSYEEDDVFYFAKDFVKKTPIKKFRKLSQADREQLYVSFQYFLTNPDSIYLITHDNLLRESTSKTKNRFYKRRRRGTLQGLSSSRYRAIHENRSAKHQWGIPDPWTH